MVRRVDEMRERSRKAQKTLDRAIKEIATWNDEISKYASDRHAIYRRCRLEEIGLPLIKGRLDKVPIEEVSDLLIPNWHSADSYLRNSPPKMRTG